MLMNLERLTDLREQSFSSPDFQVGVRNDTDGGGGGKPLKIETGTIFVKRLLQTLLAIHKTVEPRLVGWLNKSMKL